MHSAQRQQAGLLRTPCQHAGGSVAANARLMRRRQWRSSGRPGPGSRAGAVTPAASLQSPFKVQLLHPVKVADADHRPLLIFLPGTDGTGQAITPQLPGLLAAGYDVRSLYIPPDDRSGWEQLQAQTLYLLSQALAARPRGPHNVQVTILAESFGGCLALRLAAAAPHLVRQLVLLNSATCYNGSLGGLSALVSATNLLGMFPQDLYNTAQAVLLPLLVDVDRVGPEGAQALRSMIFMEPPQNFETAATQQAGDDEEQAFSTVTLAADRRLLQTNTSSTFTTSGPLQRATGPAARRRGSGNSGSGGGQPGSSGLQAMLAAMGVSSSSSSSSSGGGSRMGGSGGSGGARSGVFGPAAAANFRSNLLRNGNLPDRVLRRLDTPTLIISSAKDRMLPSLAEGARLARLMPGSRRVILPDSGHAALLERGMNLAAVMRGTGFTAAPKATRQPPAPPAAAAAAAAQAGSRPAAGQPPPAAAAGAAAAAAGAAQPGSSASNGGASSVAAAAAGAAAVSSSSSRQGGRDSPKLLGIVKDDRALPRIMGKEGPVPPRPATLLPRKASTVRAAATPASSSSSSRSGSRAGSPQGAAATAAGAMAAAATTAAGDGAAAGAAGAGGSTQAAAVATTPAGSSSSSSSSSSEKDLAWDEWSQILAPWRDLVSPVLLGQEQLRDLVGKDRPLLFVGPHGRMGLYDMPLLAYELYMRGFRVRGLAHPAHWGGPLGPFFEQFGAVPAGPMTAFKLLKANEQVLLFPGGAREVNKRVGEEHQLFWKDTPDFVRLAARCNAIIVPFAAVGADDAYDVMMEAEELLEVPVLGGLVKEALKRFDPALHPLEALLPLTRLPGLGLPTPVPIPNLQRLYFKICTPIDTQQLGLNVKRDAEGWQELYDGIKASVVSGMQELLEVRAADGQRNVSARLSKAFSSWQPAFSITQGPAGTAEEMAEVAATDAARRGVPLQPDSTNLSTSSVSLDDA